MTAWPRSSAPWIVGRPARFSDASEDFLNELTRQQPWRKARCETWLEALGEKLGDPALSATFPDAGTNAWLADLSGPEQTEARAVLAEFKAYLRECGWLADQA